MRSRGGMALLGTCVAHSFMVTPFRFLGEVCPLGALEKPGGMVLLA